ncbi:MAG TPA: glutathione S-transferase N-terminal domain-containing protein [Acidimicrobiia bacterium]
MTATPPSSPVLPAPPDGAAIAGEGYIVHGLRVSYFTRKVTGYLDHKRQPWWLRPSLGINRDARVLGWNGGIPVVTTPDGEMIWDSTSIIVHLETVLREHAVQPADPALRFLDFLLDDFSDEWFYRHAVGARWLYDENVVAGSLDIAREALHETGAGLDQTRAFATDAMTGCLVRLGTTPENIEAWVLDSLKPWQRAFGAHAQEHGYLLGARPSLADFAFFGGNAAHFVNDPVCVRWSEESPGVLQHTNALLTAREQHDGDWFDVDALPESLFAVLAEAGRHYLPWVARATIDGEAVVEFESGAHARIATTNFLTTARGVMLARYVDARSASLDAILERAGILRWYADYVDQATSVPDPQPVPRPSDNRPYPAGPGGG